MIYSTYWFCYRSQSLLFFVYTPIMTPYHRLYCFVQIKYSFIIKSSYALNNLDSNMSNTVECEIFIVRPTKQYKNPRDFRNSISIHNHYVSQVIFRPKIEFLLKWLFLQEKGYNETKSVIKHGR